MDQEQMDCPLLPQRRAQEPSALSPKPLQVLFPSLQQEVAQDCSQGNTGSMPFEI